MALTAQCSAHLVLLATIEQDCAMHVRYICYLICAWLQKRSGLLVNIL